MTAFLYLFYIIMTFDISISKIFSCKKNSFPFIISSIVLILYLFGLFNKLLYGYYFLIILTILNTLFLIYLFSTKKLLLKIFFQSKYLAFLGFLAFTFYINHEYLLICYDEFSAWGIFIKNTFDTNSFHIFSSFPMAGKSYLPGTTLFIYFLAKLQGFLSEDLMVNGLNIIYFSLAATIFDSIKLKNIAELIKRFLLVLLLPLTINLWPIPGTMILVDLLLGFLFAYILYYLFTTKISLFSLFNFSLLSFLLIEIKITGLVLVLIILLTSLSDFVFFRRKEFKNFLAQFKTKATAIIYLFLPIISILFTYLSWSFLLKSSSLNTLQPMVNTGFTEYLFISLRACFKVLYQQGKAYLLSFLLVFAGLALYLKNLLSKPVKIDFFQKRILLFSLTYLIGALIYVAFLIFVVTVQMPKELSIKAEGMMRYLTTYVVATNFLLVLFALYFDKGKKLFGITISSLLILILLQVPTTFGFFTKLIKRTHVYESQVYRQDYEPIKKILNFVNKNDLIYFYGTQEIDILIVNFNLYPFYTVYLPVNLEEIKQVNKNDSKLWLYIYKYDQAFIDNYSGIFKQNQELIENNTLYLIENIDNQLTFIKVNL